MEVVELNNKVSKLAKEYNITNRTIYNYIKEENKHNTLIALDTHLMLKEAGFCDDMLCDVVEFIKMLDSRGKR